jgi:hypothetical protein
MLFAHKSLRGQGDQGMKREVAVVQKFKEEDVRDRNSISVPERSKRKIQG